MIDNNVDLPTFGLPTTATIGFAIMPHPFQEFYQLVHIHHY